jgi:hypothetical protein
VPVVAAITFLTVVVIARFDLRGTADRALLGQGRRSGHPDSESLRNHGVGQGSCERDNFDRRLILILRRGDVAVVRPRES